MPEEYASKELASAAGAAKGISDWIKQQNELKLAQAKASSTAGTQMLRTLLPLLFRQKQFEQEQKQEWNIFTQKSTAEQAAETAKMEQTRLEFQLKLRQFDADIEDMKARREASSRDYELRRDTLSETERHNAATESFGYLQESNRLMMSMLDNVTQILTSGTFTDKTTAAQNLAKLQGEINQSTQEAINRLRESAETTAKGVETEEDKAQRLRDDILDFQTKSWIWSAYKEKPNDIDRANAAKEILDMFEARRLAIDPKYRPKASELPMIKAGERIKWGKDIRPELLQRTEEPAAPANLEPVSMEEINAIKAMGKAEKDAAYAKLYPRLKAMGKSDADIAKIESYIGIK